MKMMNDDDAATVRQRLRAEARRQGVLAEPHTPRRILSPDERSAALESARGLGKVVDEIFEGGR